MQIFYSDLLDPSHTPTFTLTRCEDPDFAIIRFRAGPPYEDIAFKIVNREWEISWKHGYKCQFQNGVFQLWFFFKRYRYRRWAEFGVRTDGNFNLLFMLWIKYFHHFLCIKFILIFVFISEIICSNISANIYLTILFVN